ncbi:uncharacterized protein P174DRAFT_455749 [Aspergillus novofumigatus IBT 16806]|uniref:Uncharacterized protein n=1 Tax=Aspergillus novofumigatus (strain IBT 16806) TaxID=1392255 RepID=A0A2I1CK04_ASPN1|nr:uncharacterized protein P174DRAFT_455749 [Aspergillus novofumigatus IBT 16806]PKX97955.1 hypothetical protein P174DRAFT_455749 [Aspergillus novofumigatus IBT 16806]
MSLLQLPTQLTSLTASASIKMNNNFSNNPPNYDLNSLPTLNNGMDHPLYTTFNYCIVFSNLPDQPWPSYNLLQQCLDKVRARDAKIYSSIDAIQRYDGAKTGDLILSFTAAAATDGVIWTSAEGAILHQMRFWDRDRRMEGWALVGSLGLRVL